MARPGLSDVRRAVTLLPGGIFILSAAFEAKRQEVEQRMLELETEADALFPHGAKP